MASGKNKHDKHGVGPSVHGVKNVADQKGHSMKGHGRGNEHVDAFKNVHASVGSAKKMEGPTPANKVSGGAKKGIKANMKHQMSQDHTRPFRDLPPESDEE